MTEADFSFCAYCPRLCRHVCPVAVATGREAATPTAMMTAAMLVFRSVEDATWGVAGTSLCCGCGACTDHCKYEVPVAARLRGFRAPHLPPPRPAPLAPVEGAAAVVCVVTDRDWAGAFARAEGIAVARLRTSDSLGHAAWKLGAADVPAAVAAHLAGREVVTASGAVAEVLAAAGVPHRRLPAPPADRTFHTCHGGTHRGPGQLACCGRREGFPAREPDAARLVAEENVRLLGGAETSCGDEECAAWLRAHGAAILDPTDAFPKEEP